MKDHLLIEGEVSMFRERAFPATICLISLALLAVSIFILTQVSLSFLDIVFMLFFITMLIPVTLISGLFISCAGNQDDVRQKLRLTPPEMPKSETDVLHHESTIDGSRTRLSITESDVVQEQLVQLWTGITDQSPRLKFDNCTGALTVPLVMQLHELAERYRPFAYFYGLKLVRSASIDQSTFDRSRPKNTKGLKSPLKQAVELHQKGQALRAALEALPITARNLPFSIVPLSDSLATTLRENGIVTPKQLITFRYPSQRVYLAYDSRLTCHESHLTSYETLPGFGLETMDALIRVTEALRQVTLSVSPLYAGVSLDYLLGRLSLDQRGISFAKTFYMSAVLHDMLYRELIDTPGDIQKQAKAYAGRFGACSTTTFLLKRLKNKVSYLDELRLILMGLLKYTPGSPSRSCTLTAKEALNQRLAQLLPELKAVPFSSLPLSPALASALAEERIHSPGELISRASDYARQWGGCTPADFLLRLSGTGLDSLAELSRHLDPIHALEIAKLAKPVKQDMTSPGAGERNESCDTSGDTTQLTTADAAALVETRLAECSDWLLGKRIESILPDCSHRLETALLAEGVVTIGDLADYPAGTLQHIPGIGRNGFLELMTCLQRAEDTGNARYDQELLVPLLDTLLDEESDLESMLNHKALGMSLNRSMKSTLSNKERYIVTRLYGLNGEETAKCSKLSSEFDYSAARIHSIRNEALAKLAHPARSRELRSFLTNDGGTAVL